MLKVHLIRDSTGDSYHEPTVSFGALSLARRVAVEGVHSFQLAEGKALSATESALLS